MADEPIIKVTFSKEIVRYLAALKKRLENMTDHSEGLQAHVQDARSYVRSDRFTADPMPKGGFGPGYAKGQNIRVVSKNELHVDFSRIAPPTLDKKLLKDWAREVIKGES